MALCIDLLSVLYHTKNYQGTITAETAAVRSASLYHTKNYQGTITQITLL